MNKREGNEPPLHSTANAKAPSSQLQSNSVDSPRNGAYYHKGQTVTPPEHSDSSSNFNHRPPPTPIVVSQDTGVDEDIALRILSPSADQIAQQQQQQQRAHLEKRQSGAVVKRRGKTIPELAKEAKIDTTQIQASSKAWLNTAESCYDRARVYRVNEELENAFIYYMKFFSIIMEIIPRQTDYHTIKSNPKLKELRKLLSSEVVKVMETIKEELKQRSIDTTASYSEDERAKGTQQQQYVDDADDFNRRYPEAPPDPVPDISSTDRLHASATAISSSTDHTDVYNGFHSRFDEIDSRARHIDQAMGPLESIGSTNIRHTNSNTASARLSMTSSSCTPEQLQRWLIQAQTAILIHHPETPKVLILDVRNSHEFLWGHIKAPNVVNIDPIGLREGCTSIQIENSLILEPELSQRLFEDRSEFDYVVYLDDSTESLTLRSGNPKHHEKVRTLQTLVNAIYHNEFERPLRNCPMILIGGFNAWVKKIGDDDVDWCPEWKGGEATGGGVLPQHTLKQSSVASSGRSLSVGQQVISRPYQLQRVPSSEIQRRREATIIDDSKAKVINDVFKTQAPPTSVNSPSNLTLTNDGYGNSIYDMFRSSQHILPSSYPTHPSLPISHQQYTLPSSTSQKERESKLQYMPPTSQFAQPRNNSSSSNTAVSAAGSGKTLNRQGTIFDDPLYAFTRGREGNLPDPQGINISVLSSPVISTVQYPSISSIQDTAETAPSVSSTLPPPQSKPPVIRSTKPHTRTTSETSTQHIPTIPPKPHAYKDSSITSSIAPATSSDRLSSPRIPPPAQIPGSRVPS